MERGKKITKSIKNKTLRVWGAIKNCDTKRKLQKTNFYGKDFQAITIVCGQLSDYKRILYIQKHSSTVSVTILTKGMVTRNGDFIVRYISTEPGFHNGDNIRIVCLNNCTELIQFGYKASCIEVYN